MSFRFRIKTPYRPCILVPTEFVPVSSFDDRGVEHVNFVSTPIKSDLPKFTDYQLTDLLEAGVPLQQVSPLLDPSQRDIDSVVKAVDNSNIQSENDSQTSND